MPCSKGMRSCAAACGHRALVESYRAERDRQWSELIEFTGGYDTEIADRLRELQENGTPLVDYKTWLKQNARPPEDRDMPVTWNDALMSRVGIGDPAAEQILLATIMEHPEHAAYLDNFRPQEFTTALHQTVAEGIQELHHNGQVPTAAAVEDWLRPQVAAKSDRTVVNHPDWNSEFYRPDKAGERIPVFKNGKETWHDRSDLGLRGWHQVAGPGVETVEYYGSVVRDNTILRMTTDAHLWAADRLKETTKAPACDIGTLTSDISWRFQEMLAEQPKPLPSQTDTAVRMPSPNPSPALKYAQQPDTGPVRAQRSSVKVKVG